MTFLIQVLSDEIQMPVPPGIGQSVVRIRTINEGANSHFQATLIARVEDGNPVNPAKGIKRAQFDFTNFNGEDDEAAHQHIVQALGFATLAACNVRPDESQEDTKPIIIL